MPVTAVYSKKFSKAARDAEGFTAAEAKTILANAPVGWLRVLSGYIDGPDFPEGETLNDIRAKFPLELPADDREASFLLRLAVADVGGLAV
jgi:hypothetical protein